MQGKRLKRLWPFSVLAVSFLCSSQMGGLKYVPIYEALVIKAQKNSPPHIAFEEMLEFEKENLQRASASTSERILAVNLNSDKKSFTPIFAKRIVIAEMVIKKDVETLMGLSSGEVAEASSNDWIQQLPRAQALRLEKAQQRGEVLGEDWSMPRLSDLVREKLEKSGALTQAAVSYTPGVYVAAADTAGNVKTSVPSGHVGFRESSEAGPDAAYKKPSSSQGFVEPASSAQVISGPIEITGGLAVTNEHYIEIRRSDEGILKELGRVDLLQGLYNIQIEESSGTIIALLLNKEGKALGEGSFKLSRLSSHAGSTAPGKALAGPKLRIEPRPDYAGIITSAYNASALDQAPPQTRVTFIKGASEVAVKKDSYASMDNVAKGSSTIMRAAAPKHLQTASIVISGKAFKSALYPTSMIQALLGIVSEQRQLSLSTDPTLIWGRASQDGKGLAGVEVSLEADLGLEPVYFNQFMLPDMSLKSTSENGLFAFVDVAPGFQSLLATRGDKIFGYQNVMVEEGSVAQGDIESTGNYEAVPLRAYDAFTGEPQSVVASLQSLDSEVALPTGITSVSLPRIHRLGMMRIQPESNDYISARYLYNDHDEFIHAPLVQSSWLNSIKSYLQIEDASDGGVVVGFVPDEDFEVYLAGHDSFESRFIVYFDMQGRILQNRKGMSGGGFILYNVPSDTHEVVVLGNRSQKIYSRVLPVDNNSLSVLTFR